MRLKQKPPTIWTSSSRARSDQVSIRLEYVAAAEWDHGEHLRIHIAGADGVFVLDALDGKSFTDAWQAWVKVWAVS